MTRHIAGSVMAAALILGMPAPGLAQLRVTPAPSPSSTVARSVFESTQVQPATANLGGDIILAWFGAGMSNEDGYGRFKMDVVGEVGLYSWDAQPSRTPAFFAAGQGAAPSGVSGPQWGPSALVGFSYINGDFGSAVSITGGLRMNRRPKTTASPRFFGEVMAGLQHDEFENALTMAPGAGVIVPMTGKRYLLYAKFNYGVTFYEGYTAKGPGISGGIGIPLGR